MFILFSAGGASAYTDIGGRYTYGREGYSGANLFAEWGNDDYYMRPAMKTYKSDVADRYSAYSLGAGLERELWRAGAEFSVAPETGGYKNSAAYADFSCSLLGGPADRAALEDVSIGVFAGITWHEDAYSISTTTVSGTGFGRRTNSSVSTLADAFKLAQTDYGLSASIKAYGLRASGRFTKTAYDKDVTIEARRLPLDIGGVGANGFPDTAFSASLRVPGLPVRPEAGYTRATYLLEQPASESFSAGLAFDAGRAEVFAGWENFNPGGGLPRSDYYSLGLTFAF
ncbi:MAG TPA: hypothetical protein DCS63_05780 [Elusimicrobia bacterium]|nr:hypothetical protein [Elusimicrobiota bacterium]